MSRFRPARFGLVLAVALCTAALAKLHPLSDDAKAKAAEAAAKSAWGDKVAAFQLCKAQDRVAGTYYADMKKEGKETKPAAATPPCADPGPFVYTPPVAAAPTAAVAPASGPASAPGKS